MKKLTHLLLIEAGPDEGTPANGFNLLLTAFANVTVTVRRLPDVLQSGISGTPDLVLLHGNLTDRQHLHQFIRLHASLPHTGIVIVSKQMDDELCLLALEAGADDSITEEQLTELYLRKSILLSQHRNRTEKKLNQNHEQLRACLHNTPNVAVQWYNGCGEVVFWNNASERLYGWTAAEALGKNVDQLISVPNDREYWLKRMLRLTQDNVTVLSEEWSFARRDGSQGYCLSTLFPLPSFESEPLFGCMDVDITERHRMEEALRAGKETYSALFDQASDAIFINSVQGQFLDANQQACALVGLSKDALLQMRVEDLYSDEELAARPIMRRELDGGQRTCIERNMMGANGKAMIVEVTAQKMNDSRIVAIIRDISKRKQAEKALKERQRELALIYNSTADVIFLVTIEEGPAYRFASANAAFYRVTGSPESVVGKTLEAVIPQSSLHKVLEKFAEAAETKKPVTWEEVTDFPHRKMYGIANATPVCDEEGVCRQLVGTVHDITGRKEAELALRQSEEKYRLLIDQQGDAIAIFDKQGRILDVNNAAAAMLDYTKEEFQELGLTDVLAADEAANPVDFVQLETGAGTIKQRKMRRKNGTVVETEVHTKRLFDGLFLASVRDLTERIDVQHRLQKEIELSESIINSLPGLFYLFTRQGKYLRWNRQQETLSGYSAAEIADMKPLDFVADADKEDVQTAIAETFQTGHSNVEADLLTKEGKTIPCYFTGIKVQYAGTECLLGTGTDLSAFKNLEDELSRQKIVEQKKVMQAMIAAEEKEKAKLGLELHDNISQILSVVRMYLSVLNSGQPMEEITLPKAIDLLNNAIVEIRHLSHSLAVGHKFETGLAGALTDAVDKVRMAKDFSVSLSLATNLDERTSVQQKLAVYRIVQEQLNNIIKHAKATLVSITAALTATEIRLEIIDNGRGFNAAKAKKGLGLNNITNRAEALSGKAIITSKPGKGTRLEVMLPLQEEVPGKVEG